MYYLDYVKVGIIGAKKMRYVTDDFWELHQLIEEIKNSNGKYIYLESGVYKL